MRDKLQDVVSTLGRRLARAEGRARNFPLVAARPPLEETMDTLQPRSKVSGAVGGILSQGLMAL